MTRGSADEEDNMTSQKKGCEEYGGLEFWTVYSVFNSQSRIGRRGGVF